MLLAERDHDRAGQRGEIDHRFRLEALLHVPKAIAEHHAALGVGVEHLDGLTGHRLDHVARTHRAAARHVLDETDDADGVYLCLARGEFVHQADHACRPGHVALHVFHAGSRLQRDAAGVEGDALADDGDRCAAFRARALPLQHRDVTGLFAALPHREQRPHAELLQGFLSQHLDLHAELGELFGACGELGRPEYVGRLVDEIAGQRDAFADGARRREGLGRRFRIGAVNDDLLQRAIIRLGGGAVFLARRALVLFELVTAQRRAEREVRNVGRRDVAP